MTDSAAALPPDWVAIHETTGQLAVVPMPVIIGEGVHSDGDVGLEAHISLALASGSGVRTSRPSPGQFAAAYQAAFDAGFDSVVSIHISANLSGTHDAAQLAADCAPLPVLVFDTRTVGMAQGAGVEAAVCAAASGLAMDGVLAAALAAVEATKVFFYVPSLEQLRRGGRISLASSWLGTVFAVKPILGIRDGSVVPLEKIRGVEKALARLEALAVKEILGRGADLVMVNLHHFGNEQQAQTMAEALTVRCPGLPAPVLTRLPAVLAAHAGLGVVVVVVSDRDCPPQGGGKD
ncbi:DegV family protein [Arthrobacter cryoconiti]|uniref:DegV family protein n=1 Tax=Arthrobacter cryoconiti TaxID=748907 RepID=A0ABV8QXX4_9MICC|nr:DegV family protein [Arthrobacter cryoconiti]MCC9069486.1 DegV family protein [Arthrobacter cryoconiti]